MYYYRCMAEPTDLDRKFEERERVLDTWVEKQRQIAMLQAESAELLIERIAIYDRDLVGNGYHRDSAYRSMVAEHSAAGRVPTGTMPRAGRRRSAICATSARIITRSSIPTCPTGSAGPPGRDRTARSPGRVRSAARTTIPRDEG